MSRVCQITGKRPLAGHNVSHANNKTKRRFLPNLHTVRLWVEDEANAQPGAKTRGRFVTVRLSTKALRTINKYGPEKVLQGLKAKGEIG